MTNVTLENINDVELYAKNIMETHLPDRAKHMRSWLLKMMMLWFRMGIEYRANGGKLEVEV